MVGCLIIAVKLAYNVMLFGTMSRQTLHKHSVGKLLVCFPD